MSSYLKQRFNLKGGSSNNDYLPFKPWSINDRPTFVASKKVGVDPTWGDPITAPVVKKKALDNIFIFDAQGVIFGANSDWNDREKPAIPNWNNNGIHFANINDKDNFKLSNPKNIRFMPIDILLAISFMTEIVTNKIGYDTEITGSTETFSMCYILTEYHTIKHFEKAHKIIMDFKKYPWLKKLVDPDKADFIDKNIGLRNIVIIPFSGIADKERALNKIFEKGTLAYEKINHKPNKDYEPFSFNNEFNHDYGHYPLLMDQTNNNSGIIYLTRNYLGDSSLDLIKNSEIHKNIIERILKKHTNLKCNNHCQKCQVFVFTNYFPEEIFYKYYLTDYSQLIYKNGIDIHNSVHNSSPMTQYNSPFMMDQVTYKNKNQWYYFIPILMTLVALWFESRKEEDITKYRDLTELTAVVNWINENHQVFEQDINVNDYIDDLTTITTTIDKIQKNSQNKPKLLKYFPDRVLKFLKYTILTDPMLYHMFKNFVKLGLKDSNVNSTKFIENKLAKADKVNLF